MAEKKVDLEEEMSRFEQEISGHLPPPPKLTDAPKTSQPLKPGGTLQAPSSRTEMSIPPPPRPPFTLTNFPLPPMPPGMRLPHPLPVMHLGDVSASGRMGDGSRSMSFGGLSGMLASSLPPPPVPPPMPLPPMPHLMVPAPMPPMMPIIPASMASGINNPALVIKPPTVPLDSYEPVISGPPEMTFEEPGDDAVAEESKKLGKNKKKPLRIAGGQVWEDSSLVDWDPNDFRLFVGDIGNEVTDDALLRAFSRYPSLQKVKVVRDKRTKKTKGFGFISFKDPQDYLKAMREMNGKYVGNRPIKLRKSTWRDRDLGVARRKEKEKKKLGLR